jgi:CHAT domain-containing protein/Flp pilus assembly protein TadD
MKGYSQVRRSAVTILPFPFLRPSSRVPIHGCVWGGLLALAALTSLGCASTPAPSPPVPGPAVPAAVSEGFAVHRELAPGGRDEIPLELESGRFLRFSIDSEDLDVVVSLLGPGEEVLAKAEGYDRLAVITAAAGSHRLVVTPLKEGAGGKYEVVLEEIHPARPEDGERASAEAILASAEPLLEQGDPEKALERAQEALCRWRKLGDREGEFQALFEMGSIHYATIWKDEAASWYGEALRVALAAGERRAAAKAWNALGTAVAGTQPEEARRYFEMALEGWTELGEVAKQAQSLYRLAAVLASLGRKDEALASHKQALARAETSQSLSTAAEAWTGMGALYVARGESQEALNCYTRALELARNRNPGVVPAILTGLGSLHRRRGEPQEALAKFQQALDLVKGRNGEPDVRNNMGPVYLDLGETDKALDEFEKALKSLQSGDGNDRAIVNTLVNIGQVDLKKSQNREALDHFEEALAISRKANGVREGVVLYYKGIAQLRLRQFSEAVQSLETALALRRQASERLGEAMALLKLGEAYQAQGDLGRAASLMREALKLADEVGAPFTQALGHFTLAQLERERGDLQEALVQIEQAIRFLESVRSELSDDRLRLSFSSSKRSYYDFYVDLLMQLDKRSPGQGFAAKALGASEMGRSRSLLDLLAEGRLDLTRGIAADLKKKEADVTARLSQIQRQLVDELSKEKGPDVEVLRARLNEVEEERQKIEQTIKSEHPLYATVRYPSPLRLEEIRDRLDGDSALLEYSLGKEGAYLFVVTREGFKAHSLPPPGEIANEVWKVRAEVEKPGLLSFAYRKAAYRLYSMLIAPARTEIAGKRRLLIAPDGALHFLSFEVLLSREASGGRDLPYLIRDFSLSYIPSASVLSWLSQQRGPATTGTEPPKQFLAYADPDYGTDALAVEAGNIRGELARGAPESWRLPRLEGTEREVSAIADLYPSSEVKIYRRREANEENVKQNGLLGTAKRIHFATHGVIDLERPEFSGLALTRTDDPSDDGFLRVYEIFNLDLSADLVVLSACETGMGKEVSGEGLVGITRAFLYAGAPSVVVSLWRVADAAAPELMLRFYENLDRSHDKAEALRQAKLAVIDAGGKYASPYYWAPFVLVGAPK